MIDREQAIEVLWRSGLGPLSREEAEHLADAIIKAEDQRDTDIREADILLANLAAYYCGYMATTLPYYSWPP